MRHRHQNTWRGVHYLDASIKKLKEMDPNPAQSATVAYKVVQAVKVCRDIFEAKNKTGKANQNFQFFQTCHSLLPSPQLPVTSKSRSSADPSACAPPLPSPPGTLPAASAAQDSSPATYDGEKASLEF